MSNTLIHNNNHGALGATVTYKVEVMQFDHVVLVGDREVSLAGQGARPLGIAQSVPDEFPGSGSVQSAFKNWVKKLCAEAIQAGDSVKLSTPDPSTGEQRYAKFDPATDNGNLEVGVCFVGGGSGEYGEFYIH